MPTRNRRLVNVKTRARQEHLAEAEAYVQEVVHQTAGRQASAIQGMLLDASSCALRMLLDRPCLHTERGEACPVERVIRTDFDKHVGWAEASLAARKRKSRLSVQDVLVATGIRAEGLYPVDMPWKSIGMSLNRDQAIALARLLLVAAQDWEQIDVTGFRRRLSDGTFEVTVSTPNRSNTHADNSP